MNFSAGSLNKKNLFLSVKTAETGNNRFSKPAVIWGTAASLGGGTRTGSLLAVITGAADYHVVVAPEPVLC